MQLKEMADQQILNCCVLEMMEIISESGEVVDFVHADPPWSYRVGATNGAACKEYECLTEEYIKEHFKHSYFLQKPDGYGAVWCTFPKLADWLCTHEKGLVVSFNDKKGKNQGWDYISGGSWGKTKSDIIPDGIGIGYHFRGDAEILLLYKKGQPKPAGKAISNLWLAHRTRHSEKPQMALRTLLELATKPGDLVMDLYAGESASMAIACRDMDRRYIGAEIDKARWIRADERLAQGVLFK